MSKKCHVVLNSAGIRELLKSSEIQSVLNETAETVARRAGEGYEAVPGTLGKTRANVRVQAATKEANKDNLENNTLLKALGR